MIEFDEILTVTCLRPMLWENGFIVSKLLRKCEKNFLFYLLFYIHVALFLKYPTVRNQVSHAVVGAYRLTIACSLAQSQRLQRSNIICFIHVKKTKKRLHGVRVSKFTEGGNIFI
jgi:hypothetical protein